MHRLSVNIFLTQSSLIYSKQGQCFSNFVVTGRVVCLVTKSCCRSMMIAGSAFLIGAIFQASAKSTIALIFIGRIFWGVGQPCICHLPLPCPCNCHVSQSPNYESAICHTPDPRARHPYILHLLCTCSWNCWFPFSRKLNPCTRLSLAPISLVSRPAM